MSVERPSLQVLLSFSQSVWSGISGSNQKDGGGDGSFTVSVHKKRTKCIAGELIDLKLNVSSIHSHASVMHAAVYSSVISQDVTYLFCAN